MKLRTTLVLFWLSLPAFAAATPLKLLFFYPGGEGSQEAAQPLLDAFTEALQKSGAPELKATYLSDKEAGLAFLKREKPAAALLSLDLFEEYGSAWSATPIARSLPLPSGQDSEQYFLVGKKGVTLPSSGKVRVYSPRPFPPDFVAQRLFPALSGVSFEMLPSRQVIGDLRKLAAGEKSGFFLLDAYEHRVMNLKTAWVAELADAAASAKVPSAPFVLFPGRMSPEERNALQKALLLVGKETSSQEVLRELRLKGFQAVP